MKGMIFLVVILLLIVIAGCAQSPMEVTVEDSNEDFVYHIGPGDGLLGNVDLYIIPETMQGASILLINGPGNPIGYQIKKDDMIYCQDSYIGSGGYTFQSGTSLPFNTWVNVNLVVYKSTFTGWFWPVADLWKALYAAIIDTTYEIEVMIIYEFDGKAMSIQVRDNKNEITIEPKLIFNINQKVQKIFKGHFYMPNK